jgi:folate-dependent phosphoribosylglycinamide formyltransferase PurN
VIVVVTHEPSFGGLDEDHVASLSSWLELPTLYARNAGEDHVIRAIKDCEPEVLVSANWRTTVPEPVLEIPSRYPVNIHDALLPGYAGFGSVNWAIRNGETLYRAKTPRRIVDWSFTPEVDHGMIVDRAVSAAIFDLCHGVQLAAVVRPRRCHQGCRDPHLAPRSLGAAPSDQQTSTPMAGPSDPGRPDPVPC